MAFELAVVPHAGGGDRHELRDRTLPYDPFSGAEPMNDAVSDRKAPRSENPGKQRKAKAPVANPSSPADIIERLQTDPPTAASADQN